MNNKTLKQFVDGLNQYLAENPEHANLQVLTARDDEGNGYNRVYFDPTYGEHWETDQGMVEGVCVS